MNEPQITKLTYRYDRLRSIPQGVIESSSSTFLLLIAVLAFDAGPTAKSFIAASGNIGLLLSLWLVPLVEQSGQKVMRVAGWIMVAGSVAMISASLAPTLVMLVLASIVAIGAANAIIPLLTSVYQDNYAPRERGRYVSRTFVIRIISAAVFGELAGHLLTQNIDYFPWVFVAIAIACAAAAWCLWRIPSKALHQPALPTSTHVDAPPLRGEGQNLGIVFSAFDSMKYLRTDCVLRWTLTSWMLMGFANLMMWPLRVDYLANPSYGLALNPQQIALYTILIPSIARLVVTPMWGWLFDRMNFFVLRITLNIGFALGIAAFFTGSSDLGLVIGSIIFGVSNAGGEIAWSLWVTKFAPGDRVAEYMSVHTFFTGVRGILAPILAFQLAQIYPISSIAVLCAALILLASLILVPEIRGQRRTNN